MTGTDVTAGLRPRRLTAADEAAVVDLLTASDLAVLGRTDFAVEEVRADLANERCRSVGWYDDGNELAAYGWAMRVGDSAKVQLDVYVRPGRPDELGTAVLAEVEAIGLTLAAAAGQPQAVYDVGAYRQDERTGRWLAARGFTVGTSFARMRIDFVDSSVGRPGPPDGVAIRRVPVDDEDGLRTAHAIDEASFAEHYAHVPQSYEDFVRRLTEHGADWCTVDLASVDGTPVGLLVGTRQFVVDEDAGYVRTLGVAPAGRGRGVAKALLRGYFAEQQAAGRAGVLLHVDVANVTNALALYESVGMRAVLVIDAWAKTTPAP